MMQTNPRKGSLEGIDPFGNSVPGISLTTDNKKWNWGNPPEEVNPRNVIDKATERLDDPDFENDVMKLLYAGVSVEHLTESWMTNGFQEGKFSLDAGLIAKAPLSLYLAYKAEQNDVPYRFFEKDDVLKRNRLDDGEFARLLKMNNPNMFNLLKGGLQEKFEGK